MIGWRRRPDGFDWHKYVRTTIKLRREQRREKLEEIGRVAVKQAKVAGNAAASGVASAASGGWRAAASGWRRTIAQPAVALPMALCGAVALLSGAHRWFSVSADRDALLPIALGALFLTLLAPLAVTRFNLKALRLPAFNWPSKVAPAAGVAVLALALGWFTAGNSISGLRPNLTAARPDLTRDGPASVLEGRATALSGEMIRLQGRLLHLSGIEAPDRQQTCTRASKQPWRCGEAALAALERLARTKNFRCVTQGGPDAAGRIEATCTIDGRDVAGELVSNGHVFSAATYFGGYAALETEARRSGTGLWSGESERPSDYRAKLWDAAKATAPDGCPIKGQVNGSRRTYLLPWAPDYARASVRSSRGEQWFCDEPQAQAAGFKPATRVASK